MIANNNFMPPYIYNYIRKELDFWIPEQTLDLDCRPDCTTFGSRTIFKSFPASTFTLIST